MKLVNILNEKLEEVCKKNKMKEMDMEDEETEMEDEETEMEDEETEMEDEEETEEKKK